MIAQALPFIKSFQKFKFLNLFDYFFVILCQINRLGNTIREKRKSKNGWKKPVNQEKREWGLLLGLARPGRG